MGADSLELERARPKPVAELIMPLPTGFSSDKTAGHAGRSPVVQHESDGCVIGSLDDILLVVWTKQPRLEQVLELRV